MIIYNVTSKVDNHVAATWASWMKDVHMPDLMATGLFFDYRLCRLLEQDESEGITYTAQYFLENMDKYNEYIDVHSQRLREHVTSLFGGKFASFRTLMEEL